MQQVTISVMDEWYTVEYHGYDVVTVLTIQAETLQGGTPQWTCS